MRQQQRRRHRKTLARTEATFRALNQPLKGRVELETAVRLALQALEQR